MDVGVCKGWVKKVDPSAADVAAVGWTHASRRAGLAIVDDALVACDPRERRATGLAAAADGLAHLRVS